eukprot:1279332-Lingulodinium_polyedra.AAC.1
MAPGTQDLACHPANVMPCAGQEDLQRHRNRPRPEWLLLHDGHLLAHHRQGHRENALQDHQRLG